MRRQITIITSVAGLALTSSAGVAGARPIDVPTPNAPARTVIDLRSADARSASLVAPQARTPVDLRSPDARDVGRQAPGSAAAPVQASPAENGFDWGDAGIGAGVLLVGLLGAGTIVTLHHRRRPRFPLAH
jgi:hypothetical protein